MKLKREIKIYIVGYIVGYVAHKFRHKYPESDIPTKILPLTDNWLFCISRGNCTE